MTKIIEATRALATDPNGNTAFHRCKNAEETAALIKLGLNPDTGNVIHQTPLHWACMDGKPDVVRVLIGAGANVNAVTNFGITPLYYACFNDHVDCARLLIAAGANLSPLPIRGETTSAFHACRSDEMRALFAEADPEVYGDAPRKVPQIPFVVQKDEYIYFDGKLVVFGFAPDGTPSFHRNNGTDVVLVPTDFTVVAVRDEETGSLCPDYYIDSVRDFRTKYIDTQRRILEARQLDLFIAAHPDASHDRAAALGKTGPRSEIHAVARDMLMLNLVDRV